MAQADRGVPSHGIAFLMPLETVSQALTIREQGYSNYFREQANGQLNDAT
jgi:hypothetical protein